MDIRAFLDGLAEIIAEDILRRQEEAGEGAPAAQD